MLALGAALLLLLLLLQRIPKGLARALVGWLGCQLADKRQPERVSVSRVSLAECIFVWQQLFGGR